tara:strand:- start:50 stop:1171 length:1122 start_codon:yes stop_codon:yes gene_type:complete
MNSEVKNGFLVVADISGYTRFLAETELEHANGIVKDLFDSMIPEFKKSVTISKFMGDAIFAHVENIAYENSQFMVDFSKRVYNSFSGKKDLIRINTDCTCNACKHMDELDLKIFVHHGEYMSQNINDNEELAGSDVNTIFRLMKNTVVEDTGIEAYLLLTESALKAMNLDYDSSSKMFGSEEYEHVGKVNYLIDDLFEHWQQSKNTKKHFIEKNDPLLIDELSEEFCVSADIAFLMYTKPEWRKINLHADKIDMFNKSSTQGVGTKLHCHHGDEVTKMEITDWNPGEYISLRFSLPFGLSLRGTYEFIDTENGCIMKLRFGKVESSNILSKIMAGYVTKNLKKEFPPAFQGLLQGMQEFAKTIYDENPELQMN